jgi:uncharacterized membrane protein YciS (DUF1049 family)
MISTLFITGFIVASILTYLGIKFWRYAMKITNNGRNAKITPKRFQKSHTWLTVGSKINKRI